MASATLQDLEMEMWLRKRNSGQIIWTTKSGEEIPINQMSDTHLYNAINMLGRKQLQAELTEEYYAQLFERL